MKTVETSNKDDFGDTRHTASTEPYFYDSAYQLVKRQQALPVDKQGKCVVAEITIVEKNKNKENKRHPHQRVSQLLAITQMLATRNQKTKKIQWKHGPALVSVKP